MMDSGKLPSMKGAEIVGTIGYGNMSAQGKLPLGWLKWFTSIIVGGSETFTYGVGLKTIMIAMGVPNVEIGNTKRTFYSVEEFDSAMKAGWAVIPWF